MKKFAWLMVALLILATNPACSSGVDDLDVEESTGRYSTGTCEMTASFRDVPLGVGPYQIEYFVDGDINLDSREFETFDLEY
jgi:hypothetical protein